MKLFPWECWEPSAPEDFMRDDPDEANHPSRIRMCNEAAMVGGKILEIGCGTAIDYPRLTRMGLKYSAVELTPKFIARARELHPGIDIRQGRIWDLPFEDDSFDVVYCRGVVQHLPPETYPEALDEMWRVAKTLLLVSTNRLFRKGKGITYREKGGPYVNHYVFDEFNGYIKTLPGSISRYVSGFMRPEERERNLRLNISHTIFIVYDADYWRANLQ